MHSFINTSSVSQSVSQSASQPVSQSASQPVSQSVSQPVSQSASQPVKQSVSRCSLMDEVNLLQTLIAQEQLFADVLQNRCP